MSAHLSDKMGKIEDMTDEELALLYVEGNNQAFNLLLSRNEVKLFSYIMLVVHDEDLANDIFQETFVKVITKLQNRQYAAHGKFGAWCMRIAHNVIMDRYRDNHLKNLLELTDRKLSKLAPGSITQGNTEDCLVKAQVLQDVKTMVDMLPPLQREVVYMHYYQQLTFKEIAELTHTNISTTLGRMRYAITALRRMIKKYDLCMKISD